MRYALVLLSGFFALTQIAGAAVVGCVLPQTCTKDMSVTFSFSKLPYTNAQYVAARDAVSPTGACQDAFDIGADHKKIPLVLGDVNVPKIPSGNIVHAFKICETPCALLDGCLACASGPMAQGACCTVATPKVVKLDAWGGGGGAGASEGNGTSGKGGGGGFSTVNVSLAAGDGIKAAYVAEGGAGGIFIIGGQGGGGGGFTQFEVIAGGTTCAASGTLIAAGGGGGGSSRDSGLEGGNGGAGGGLSGQAGSPPPDLADPLRAGQGGTQVAGGLGGGCAEGGSYAGSDGHSGANFQGGTGGFNQRDNGQTILSYARCSSDPGILSTYDDPPGLKGDGGGGARGGSPGGGFGGRGESYRGAGGGGGGYRGGGGGKGGNQSGGAVAGAGGGGGSSYSDIPGASHTGGNNENPGLTVTGNPGLGGAATSNQATPGGNGNPGRAVITVF